MNAGLTAIVRPDRAEALLWRRHRLERDAASRQALFTLHLPFAKRIARFEHRRRPTLAPDLADLEQLAAEGLLHAIDRFDPIRSFAFRAYAKKRIAGHIADRAPQMSERADHSAHRRRIERARLASIRDNAAADDDPLSALADLAVNLAAGFIVEEGLHAHADAADPSPDPYHNLEWKQLLAAARAEIERLPTQEAFVIRQHYGEEVSFTNIAAVLGLSKGRVSQIHAAAIRRMADRIGGA